MAHVYSTYEAKARFSEVIRKVRAGQRVVIAYRGVSSRPICSRQSCGRRSLAKGFRSTRRN